MMRGHEEGRKEMTCPLSVAKPEGLTEMMCGHQQQQQQKQAESTRDIWRRQREQKQLEKTRLRQRLEPDITNGGPC